MSKCLHIASTSARAKVKRSRRDPIKDPPDSLLIAEYRLNRRLILELCELLRPKLQRRGNALTVEEIVLICLKLLASGSFQNVAKDYVNVGQSTVNLILGEFLDALGEQAIRYIFMPRNTVQAMQQFHSIAEFPGAIDGTHVPIIAPPENEHLYVGRKGYHYTNSQPHDPGSACSLERVEMGRRQNAGGFSFSVRESPQLAQPASWKIGDLATSGRRWRRFVILPCKIWEYRNSSLRKILQRAWSYRHMQTGSLTLRGILLPTFNFFSLLHTSVL